jgi:hypothetical protein
MRFGSAPIKRLDPLNKSLLWDHLEFFIFMLSKRPSPDGTASPWADVNYATLSETIPKRTTCREGCSAPVHFSSQAARTPAGCDGRPEEYLGSD